MNQTLAASLRQAVIKETQLTSDCRFEFGTEYASEFKLPAVEAYNGTWKPLPLSKDTDAHELGRHLVSQSAIFPRLHSDPEVVKGKLVPKITDFITACKVRDLQGSGHLSTEQLVAALKETGVFLSTADVHEALLPLAPRNTTGLINYEGLADVLLGKETSVMLGGITTGRPKLPQNITWPEGQEFVVVLRKNPTSEPFVFDAEHMSKFARKASQLCREEVDAEKVHALLRTYMLQELVVEAGSRPGHPDFAFKSWLSSNSVMSLSLRSGPEPIPAAYVYDVMDQVIYDGLGLPPVVSSTQILTALGSSMRRSQK